MYRGFEAGQVDIAGDTLQEVVEIMGDAGSELSNGFHFLRETELLFPLHALSHVNGRTKYTFHPSVFA